MSEPKNCPWCGGPTTIIRSEMIGKSWVSCITPSGCGARGPTRSDREAAIAAWDAIVLVQPNAADVVQCPTCGSDDMEHIDAVMVGESLFQWACDACGSVWPVGGLPVVRSTLGDALDGPWPIRYVSREEIERLYPQPRSNLQTMTDEESQIP